GRFFSGHSQQSIELRQSQFMAEKFGSERPYPGRDLELAHRRMYIPQRLLELRQQLLREALEEEGLDQNCIDRWLRIDRVFWSQVRNTSLESFQSIDLKFEQPLIIPDPATGRI
ncbi:MAG: group 1 truncated hemoglobin, partial [Zetaproteobacteria bacterium]